MLPFGQRTEPHRPPRMNSTPLVTVFGSGYAAFVRSCAKGPSHAAGDLEPSAYAFVPANT
jgi:hypothetical protein